MFFPIAAGRYSQRAALNPAAGGGAPTAPAQFGTGDWSVTDDATSGDITITITALPGDGGSAITDLEYQLDGGSWVSLAGTTTGDYPVTGLTDFQEYDVALRAVNAIGNGTASATKAVTPTDGSTPILDGTTPTGAWSMSRDLLTAFIGNARYTNVSGVVSSLADQSGNGYNLAQGTAANRPTITTAGPNSVDCMDFDGSNDVLSSNAPTVTANEFIAAAAGYMVVSILPDAITVSSATPYSNHGILAEGSGYIGLYLRNTDADVGDPDTLIAFNYDGSNDVATSASIVVGTAYVVEWKHESGQVSCRVNGGTWVNTASGNTAGGYAGQTFRMGAGVSVFYSGKIFEAATWSTVPDGTTRDAIVANFMAHIGI